jgi:hypothetical protein
MVSAALGLDQIDFTKPTAYQLGYTGYCLEFSRQSLASCAFSVIKVFPAIGKKLPCLRLTT